MPGAAAAAGGGERAAAVAERGGWVSGGAYETDQFTGTASSACSARKKQGIAAREVEPNRGELGRLELT